MLDRIIPFNLRGIFVAIVVGITTLISASLIIAESYLRPKADITRWVRPWTALILWAAGINVHITHPERIPKPGYLVLANHQSFFDIIAILHMFPQHVRFVAKIELFAVPFFGRGMERLGHIKINRRNREAAIESLRIAGERVRGGIPVMAFPEGTRNREVGTLGPFKKGAFHLAQELRVPIVPIWIEGSGTVNPPASVIIRRSDITLHLGEIIEPSQIPDNIEDSMDLVRERILAAKKEV